jgi:hypothetical protein
VRFFDAPNKDIDVPNKDIDARSKDIDAPNKDIDARSKDIDAPNKDLNARSKDIDAPNKDIDARSKDIDAPNKDIDVRNKDINARSIAINAPGRELSMFDTLVLHCTKRFPAKVPGIVSHDTFLKTVAGILLLILWGFRGLRFFLFSRSGQFFIILTQVSGYILTTFHTGDCRVFNGPVKDPCGGV